MSISIQQARKTLGKKGEKLSDEEIQKIIDLLTRLANHVIDRVIDMSSEERKALDDKIKKEKATIT